MWQQLVNDSTILSDEAVDSYNNMVDRDFNLGVNDTQPMLWSVRRAQSRPTHLKIKNQLSGEDEHYLNIPVDMEVALPNCEYGLGTMF